MRCICIVFILSVCQVVFSQRFIEEGNFRNRKRGNSGRFRGRFLLRPGQRQDWKMEYNNLGRLRHGNRDYNPWGPRNLEEITQPVTPGNVVGPSDIGPVTPDVRPVGAGLTPQLGNIYCAYCCRVPWYYYYMCIRRFCQRGPIC